jgi:hypothetical protein
MVKIRESESELKAARKVALIASRNDARRSRVLDSRTRSIGVDVGGIAEQLAQNEKRADDDAEAKRQWDEFVVSTDQHVRNQEAAAAAARRAARASTESLWKAQAQSRELRAEFDLSNPNQLRLDPVPTPETAGVSGAQLSDAQDQRERQQSSKAAQRELILAKVEENLRMREAEREQAARDAAELQAQIARRLAVEQEEAAQRARRAAEVRAANVKLAEIKAERARAQAAEEARLAALNLTHVRASQMLSEARERKADETGRIVRQEWKGMTPSQLQAVRADQERQRTERAEAQLREQEHRKAQDANWERSRQFAVQVENAKAAERAAAARRTQAFQGLQKDHVASKAQQQSAVDKQEHPVWWPFGRDVR